MNRHVFENCYSLDIILYKVRLSYYPEKERPQGIKPKNVFFVFFSPAKAANWSPLCHSSVRVQPENVERRHFPISFFPPAPFVLQG